MPGMHYLKKIRNLASIIFDSFDKSLRATGLLQTKTPAKLGFIDKDLRRVRDYLRASPSGDLARGRPKPKLNFTTLRAVFLFPSLSPGQARLAVGS